MTAAGAWYAVIDGAQDARLADLVRGCASHLCLLKGDLAPKLAQAAPWLVRIDEREALIPTWRQHGAGGNWGIMAYSALSLEALQRHFRRFLQARLPNGAIVMFRFYDPRVFNTFIRAAAPEERTPWFDGVSQYAVEPDDAGAGGLHQYRLHEGRLYDGGQPLA